MDDKVKNTEFIFNIVNKQMRKQSDRIDSLGQKAGILFGLDGIVLPLILSGFRVTSKPSFYLLYLGVFLLFLSMTLLFLEYKTYVWRDDPNPENFFKKYQTETYKTTLQQLTSNLVESYKKNAKFINKKAELLDSSIILTFFGILSCILSFIL